MTLSLCVSLLLCVRLHVRCVTKFYKCRARTLSGIKKGNQKEVSLKLETTMPMCCKRDFSTIWHWKNIFEIFEQSFHGNRSIFIMSPCKYREKECENRKTNSNHFNCKYIICTHQQWARIVLLGKRTTVVLVYFHFEQYASLDAIIMHYVCLENGKLMAQDKNTIRPDENKK